MSSAWPAAVGSRDRSLSSLAAGGASVHVQLAQDRLVAETEGLTLETVQGDILARSLLGQTHLATHLSTGFRAR